MTTASTELSGMWSSLSPGLHVTVIGGGVRSLDSELACSGKLPEALTSESLR